jgi:hypothetical protein
MQLWGEAGLAQRPKWQEYQKHVATASCRKVLRYSEDLDPCTHGIEPDLVAPDYDYDDETFVEMIAAYINEDELR